MSVQGVWKRKEMEQVHKFSPAGVDGVPRVGSRTAPNHQEQNAEGETEEAMETGQFDDADD